MRRVMAVVVIGVLMTLSLGVDQVSWAGQDTGGKDRDTQRERIVRRLAELRPGSTVEIQRTDGINSATTRRNTSRPCWRVRSSLLRPSSS